MTPQEFAAKCEWEGGVTGGVEWGLTASNFTPGTAIHAAMVELDRLSPEPCASAAT